MITQEPQVLQNSQQGQKLRRIQKQKNHLARIQQFFIQMEKVIPKLQPIVYQNFKQLLIANINLFNRDCNDKIASFIAAAFKKNQIRKILNLYLKKFVIPQIKIIIDKFEIKDLEEMSDDNWKTIFQFITKKQKEQLVSFLQEFVQNLPNQFVETLIQLGNQPILEEQDQKESLFIPQQIKQYNNEVLRLTYLLQSAKINIQSQIIHEIIRITFIEGSFSKSIDNLISKLQISKPLKNKCIQIYSKFYRVRFSPKIIQMLIHIEMDQEKTRQSIIKGQQQKVAQQIQQYEENFIQKDINILEFTEEVLNSKCNCKKQKFAQTYEKYKDRIHSLNEKSIKIKHEETNNVTEKEMSEKAAKNKIMKESTIKNVIQTINQNDCQKTQKQKLQQKQKDRMKSKEQEKEKDRILQKEQQQQKDRMKQKDQQKQIDRQNKGDIIKEIKRENKGNQFKLSTFRLEKKKQSSKIQFKLDLSQRGQIQIEQLNNSLKDEKDDQTSKWNNQTYGRHEQKNEDKEQYIRIYQSINSKKNDQIVQCDKLIEDNQFESDRHSQESIQSLGGAGQNIEKFLEKQNKSNLQFKQKNQSQQNKTTNKKIYQKDDGPDQFTQGQYNHNEDFYNKKHFQNQSINRKTLKNVQEEIHIKKQTDESDEQFHDIVEQPQQNFKNLSASQFSQQTNFKNHNNLDKSAASNNLNPSFYDSQSSKLEKKVFRNNKQENFSIQQSSLNLHTISSNNLQNVLPNKIQYPNVSISKNSISFQQKYHNNGNSQNSINKSKTGAANRFEETQQNIKLENRKIQNLQNNQNKVPVPNKSNDRKFLASIKEQKSEYQQQIRYILIIYDKNSTVSIEDEKRKILSSNQIFVRTFNSMEGCMIDILKFRIGNQNKIYYLCNRKKGGFLQGQTKLWHKLQTKNLQKQVLKLSFFQNKGTQKQHKQAIMLYIFSMINAIQKQRRPQKIWNLLVYASNNQFLTQKILLEGSHIFEQISKDQLQKLTINQLSSRLFLNFLIQNYPLVVQQKKFLQFISVPTNFSQFTEILPAFAIGQSSEKEKQASIVIEIIFQKIYRKSSFPPQQLLIRLIGQKLSSQGKFEQSFSFLKKLKQIYPTNIHNYYLKMKKQIKLQKFDIPEYLMLNLILMSNQSQKSTWLSKGNQSANLDYTKRCWIVAILKQVIEYCSNIKNTAYLKDMTNSSLDCPNSKNKIQYIFNEKQNQKIVRQVFQTNDSQFLFYGKNQFLQFLYLITTLYHKFGVDLRSCLLKKYCNQQRLKKSIKQFLKHSQKYTGMIAFLCSLPNNQFPYGSAHIRSIISQVPYKDFYGRRNYLEFAQRNILDVIYFWFKYYFTETCNAEFCELYIEILKRTKPDYFSLLGILTTLQNFAQIQQKKQHLHYFIQTMFRKFDDIINLDQLRQHLIQIKDLYPSLRLKYVTLLAQYSLLIAVKTKISVERLEYIVGSIIYEPSILNDDKQIILKSLLQNQYQQQSQKELTQKILDCLVNGKQQIKLLTYHKGFFQSLKMLLETLEKKQIHYRKVQNIKQNMSINSAFYLTINNLKIQTLNKISLKTKEIVQKVESLKNKSSMLIRTLLSYEKQEGIKIFNSQIQQLRDLFKDPSKQIINDFLRKCQKYNEFLENAQNIAILMKTPLWNCSQIKNMQDLLFLRQTINQRYKILIKQYLSKQLSYEKFKMSFKIENMNFFLGFIFQQKLKKLMQVQIYLVDEASLNHIKESMRAVNSVCQTVTGRLYFEKQEQQFVQELLEGKNKKSSTIQKHEMAQEKKKQLQNSQANIQGNKFQNKPILFCNVIEKLRNIQKKFNQLKFSISITQKTQQTLKSLIYKQKYLRVFNLIKQKSITSNAILNELKQYINDVEYSILRIQDIKQLQHVVIFCEMFNIKQGTLSLLNFIQNLRKNIEEKQLKLSNYIYNVDSKIKQFQQIIDSCANRQTSFKYDLQEILKKSIFKIKNQNNILNIQIEVQKEVNQNQIKRQLSQKLIPLEEIPQNKMMQKSKQNAKIAKNNNVFTMKKLAQLKDKSILLVTDFQRSQQNQGIMQQTILLIRQFLNLFNIIEQIQRLLQTALIYGYDPQGLQKQQPILNGNYEEIKKLKIQIQKQANNWIKQIKLMQNQSYVLTHFMGSNLNNFIQGTINCKYNSILERIIDINPQQFNHHCQNMIYLGLQNELSKPLSKVEQICRIYKKFETATFQRFQRESIIKEMSIKSKIQLITCHRIQNYYFALVKGNSKPQMNQILYCQKQTSSEQIQVFLKRAVIKNQKKHYFIGLHYLPTDRQLKFIDLLNQYLKTQQKRKAFAKTKLTFIDNSSDEKVYNHLCKRQLFDSKQITDTHLVLNEEQKPVIQNIGETYLIQSRIPGLGKTYRAEKIKKNTNIIYFSIAGNVSFSRLLERLKEKSFQQKSQNKLIIQIGHVQNKQKLEVFLFEIIFFKGFNFKQLFYLPKNTTIVVEIENTQQDEDIYKFYSILKIIKQKSEKYILIDNFELKDLSFDFTKVQQAFVFQYLKRVDNNSVVSTQLRFDQFKSKFIATNGASFAVSTEEARQLIEKYFLKYLNNTQPTFWIYKSFVKILFTAFKTFSQNGCFNIDILRYNHGVNKALGLDQARIDFLRCCIRNSIQFLQATVNTNEFSQQFHQNSNAQEQFRDKLSKFPFLIMPASDFQNYEFVYLNSEGVDNSIKSLIISQTIHEFVRFNKSNYKKQQLERNLTPQMVKNLFGQKSLEKLNSEQFQRQIYRILHVLSNNKSFLVDDKADIKQFRKNNAQIESYSITLDNFFKMCIVIQRAVSNIPIIIMGESGVGKTALITFLVRTVFQQTLLTFNIHAGVDQQTLCSYYKQILKAAQAQKSEKGQKVWVFFDQFNTTDELSYLKEMIIDRRFQGQEIPENVVFLAACNPYRQRKQSNYKSAGIKKKQNAGNQSQGEKNLAFKVKPPSYSMIQFMWDFQQLQQKQNSQYISKMLESLNLKDHRKVVQTLSFIHEEYKRNLQISAVSLRDVARFKELYRWFMKEMPRQAESNFYKQNPNYVMDQNQRAISLALAFCYSLRIAEKPKRKNFLGNITRRLGYQHDIETVLQNQQTDYVQRFKISADKIAINFSLRQNLFTTFICIMNKIPILIIGNP